MFPMCCCASKTNASVLFADDPSRDDRLGTSSAFAQQQAEAELRDPLGGFVPAQTPEVAVRVVDERVPQPGETFRITIQRSVGQNIGLDTDLIDDESVVVVAIKPGVFQMWNDAHLGRAVRLNDRITEVNGVRGNTNSMISTLKAEPIWNLELQRPREYKIELIRTKTPSLGLDLRYAPNGTSLLIRAIGEGPVQDWNIAHKNQQVSLHDRIVELNGTRGTPQQILEASVGIARMELTILHYGR